MDRLPSDLIELMEAACNGELTDAQFDRLQEMLQADADTRAVYVRYMGLDADLWQGAGDEEPLRQGTQLPVVAPTPPWTGIWGKVFRAPAPSLTIGVFLGASIALSLWVFGNTWDAIGSSQVSAPVAHLTRAVDTKWQASQQKPPKCGDSLLPGRSLTLREGLAEITFQCGARAILQGHTTCELVSDSGCYLRGGRLVAVVPQQATEFVVETPSTTVVDMGTEFGVEVDEHNMAEIVVFEGELDVRRPPHEAPETARVMPDSFRLVSGQSTRIAMDRVVADPQVDPSRYVRNAEMTQQTRSVAFREDFSADQLDAGRWETCLWSPGAAVNLRDGQVELVNRGYLATAEQFDPLKLGGIRITGKWKFITPPAATGNAQVNIMTIALRSGLEASQQWYEAANGVTFTCYTSSRWPSITTRGEELEIATARRIGNVGRDRSGTYEFELIDDGKNVSFKFWDIDDPAKVAQATTTVTRDGSSLNHVVFYCREAQSPDWTYKALLDDVVIETGVGPCM